MAWCAHGDVGEICFLCEEARERQEAFVARCMREKEHKRQASFHRKRAVLGIATVLLKVAVAIGALIGYSALVIGLSAARNENRVHPVYWNDTAGMAVLLIACAPLAAGILKGRAWSGAGESVSVGTLGAIGVMGAPALGVVVAVIFSALAVRRLLTPGRRAKTAPPAGSLERQGPRAPS